MRSFPHDTSRFAEAQERIGAHRDKVRRRVQRQVEEHRLYQRALGALGLAVLAVVIFGAVWLAMTAIAASAGGA